MGVWNSHLPGLYVSPRYWDLVQRHKVTQFYTAPTAIRALMSFGPNIISNYDLSSLKVLGSVGEPINPEAWRWYDDHVSFVNGGGLSVLVW